MIDIEKVVSAINYNGNPMELAGGGSLPTSISKIDGGSFTFTNDKACNQHYISHNLGVIPKGFIIWNDDTEQYTAGIVRTIKLIVSMRRTMLKPDSTVFSLGTDYFSMWNADGTPYYNKVFNYNSEAQINNEYSTTTIRFNYDSACYGGGMTYKWLAWA